MKNVIIIGGGAAGLMTAALFVNKGEKVILLEKNEKLGKKLYITGKGRCNVTNASDMEEVMNNIITNKKFMYSAFNKFNNYDVMGFFEDNGVPLKVERGMRVFPESDKASDIIAGLQKAVRDKGVDIRLNTEVKKLIIEDGVAKGVVLKSGESLQADAVVVATGGISYPSTGSTGDGYKWAKEVGHKVTKLYPSLVAFQTKENYVRELAGLSLKNISVSIEKDEKELYSAFGEMLFTHTGVSGPIILTASSLVGVNAEGATLTIDLKPALTEEELDERLVRDFSVDKKKQLKSILRGLLPASMAPVFIEKLGISGDKVVSNVTKEERGLIIQLLKGFKLTILRLCGYNEAVITKGGIEVKEINPQTMESKLVKGLYFVGELLDVDALTGGFNLQIAWSTAAACASHLLEN